MSCRTIQLVNVNKLISALQNDPELARVNPSILPHVLQTLYVVSGCDYISFFSETGKATFQKHFYQHAAFITGGEHNTTGTLADTSLENEAFNSDFLAFMRLVGAIYFKNIQVDLIHIRQQPIFLSLLMQI